MLTMTIEIVGTVEYLTNNVSSKDVFQFPEYLKVGVGKTRKCFSRLEDVLYICKQEPEDYSVLQKWELSFDDNESKVVLVCGLPNRKY